MAEIRKYDPAVGNAIAQALRDAMGDPIRPATPGAAAKPSAPTEPTPAPSTSWVSLSFGTDQPASEHSAE